MKSLDERPSRAMGPAHNQIARALTKQCLKNGDQDITGPLGPRIIHTNKYRIDYKRPPARR